MTPLLYMTPGWLHSKHCTKIHSCIVKVESPTSSALVVTWTAGSYASGFTAPCAQATWFVLRWLLHDWDHKIIRSWHVFIWIHEYCLIAWKEYVRATWPALEGNACWTDVLCVCQIDNQEIWQRKEPMMLSALQEQSVWHTVGILMYLKS